MASYIEIQHKQNKVLSVLDYLVYWFYIDYKSYLLSINCFDHGHIYQFDNLCSCTYLLMIYYYLILLLWDKKMCLFSLWTHPYEDDFSLYVKSKFVQYFNEATILKALK